MRVWWTSPDIGSFMCGEAGPFADVALRDNRMYQSLITETPDDSTTYLVLEVVFQDLAKLFLCLLQDQLPDGKHSAPLAAKHAEVQSCRKHNTLTYLILGQLDYYKRRKPSATTLTHEAALVSLHGCLPKPQTRCVRLSSSLVVRLRPSKSIYIHTHTYILQGL
jgi:hypothetical protein